MQDVVRSLETLRADLVVLDETARQLDRDDAVLKHSLKAGVETTEAVRLAFVTHRDIREIPALAVWRGGFSFLFFSHVRAPLPTRTTGCWC
jgi:ABC-type molybdenum transport system ATPase subunit/photorepair protein PhrA